MSDTPALDYDRIARRVAETVALTDREAQHTFSSEPIVIELSAADLDEMLRRPIIVDMPELDIDRDAAIRADCELLWDWRVARARHDGWTSESEARSTIVSFVLNRRGVLAWPSWANAWVHGEEG